MMGGTGVLSITTTGTVSSTGSIGIAATTTLKATDSGITVNANNVTAISYGIFARNGGTGAVSITTTGDVNSRSRIGVYARNGSPGSDLTVNVNNVTANANGIVAEHGGSGAASITTTGNVVGRTDPGINATNGSGTTDLTIAVSSGTVSGVTGITAANNSSNSGATTTITISDGASVTGTGGTALNLSSTTGASGTVNNAGSITGNVTFAAGDDTFNHLKASTPVVGGVLQIVDGSIDFGAGNNTFRNRSVLEGFAGTLPAFMTTGTVTFANTGEIRLMNGTAGDVFAISHNFVGETGSRLTVDVDLPNGTADRLQITGTVSGTTEVTINPLQPGIATTNQVRIVEVIGVAGAAATNAFELASGSEQIGLFAYELDNIDTPTGDDFVLSRTGLSAQAAELPAVSGAISETFQRNIPRYHERLEGRASSNNNE